MAEHICLRQLRRKSRNWNLGEEISRKRNPVNFSSSFVIFGRNGSGKKTLALRLANMNADSLPVSEAQFFFTSSHIWTPRSQDTQRTVTLHLLAYIYPPPENENYSYSDHCIGILDGFCCRVFLFDITSWESFNTARGYMREYGTRSPVPCFLVGSKCDLKISVPQQRIVSKEAIEYEASRRRMRYFECSALAKLKVHSLLKAIQESAIQRKYRMDV